MVKKIVLVVLLVASSLHAEALKWAKDFNSGIERAKKEHKPVMFVYSRHGCKYCMLLEGDTFSNQGIVKNLNKNFISVVSYSDENDYIPRELWRPGTPTIWFLDSDGMPMYQPIMGYVDSKQFPQILEVVKLDFKKLSNPKKVKK